MRESIGFACNAIFGLPRAPIGPLRGQGHGQGQWVFCRRPPRGGVRHGTVVRGGAVEAGLGPCVGQLAARSAAFWVLFRLLRCGGSAGAAQVVCVCPGCLGRESAGGLSQALATGEDLGARGDCGLARVNPGSRFVRGNFISCKPCYLHKITECCCQRWTELLDAWSWRSLECRASEGVSVSPALLAGG